MFQFGPFGNKKPVQPTDPVAQLTAIAKQIVDDPSVLNQNLREVCQHLGSPLHDKADQLLGTMVASHSSRMLSTLWTVLLQRLRESQDVRAQLAILRHFSQVVDRISIPQRGNAFRVFAKEALLFAEKPEIVADRSFGKSFVAIIKALGVHADADLCQELLQKSIHALLTWPRLDARRAAATQAACIVGSTARCGTFAQFMSSTIEGLEDSVGKALLVDATTGPAIEQTNKLCSRSPYTSPLVLVYKTHVEQSLLALLRPYSGSDAVAAKDFSTNNTTILPLLVSSALKLKGFDRLWQPAEFDVVLSGAIRLLRDATIKKVLVSPLLSLLRALPLPPSGSSLSQDVMDVVVARCQDEDSMNRCEAYGCLESILPMIVDGDVVRDLVLKGLEAHRAHMAERCNVTIRGLLGFLAAAYPRVDSDTLGARMLHVLTRAHLDLSNTVNKVPTVQYQLLLLLEHTVAYLSPGSIAYILFCLHHGDATVRERAIIVLVSLCENATLDGTQLFDPVLRGLDYLEDAYLPPGRPPTMLGDDPMVRYVRNANILLSYFTNQLVCSSATTSDNATASAVRVCCEAIKAVASSVRQKVSASGWVPSSFAPVLTSTFVSLLRVLMDLLTSVVTLPLDVVTVVLHTAATCASGCSPTDCFDIYLHKGLFTMVWNVLHRCCSAIDPMAAPKLHQEPSLYLSHSALHRSIEGMIHQASQSALATAERANETNFHKLVEGCTSLVLSLARWGRRSPVFVAHMRHQYRFVLACLDILAASHPIAALETCQEFFIVMFCEAGELATAPHQPSSSITTACELDETTLPSWKPQVLCLSESVPALQRTKYVAASVSILNRSLSFDLVHVGIEIFRTIQLFIAVDVATNDVSCYRAIDEKLSLFKRMTDIVADKNYYNAVHGSLVAFPVLQTLAHLYHSPHRPQVEEVSNMSALVERVLPVINESRCEIGEETLFGDCQTLLCGAASQLSGDQGEAEPSAATTTSAHTLLPSAMDIPSLVSCLEKDHSYQYEYDLRVVVTVALQLRVKVADTPEDSESRLILKEWTEKCVAEGASLRSLVTAAALNPASLPDLVSRMLSTEAVEDVMEGCLRLLRHEPEDVLASLEAPEFPMIHSTWFSTAQLSECASEILTRSLWVWAPPSSSDAACWDYYFPQQHGHEQPLPPSFHVLPHLVRSGIALPRGTLQSPSLWLQCLTCFPDLPLIRYDLIGAATMEGEEGEDCATSADRVDDEQPRSTSGDSTATMKSVSCIAYLLTHLKLSFSEVRMLAMIFAEVVPFGICVQRLREGLDREDVPFGASFCVWVENQAMLTNGNPDQLPSSGTTAMGEDGESVPVASSAAPTAPTDGNDATTTTTTTKLSAVDLILSLPHRSLCMSTLTPSDLVLDTSLGLTTSLRRYFLEASKTLSTQERCIETLNLLIDCVKGSLSNSSTTTDEKSHALLSIHGPELVIAYANAFIRCNSSSASLTPSRATILFELLIRLLKESDAEHERTLSLRYSSIFLVTLFSPDRELFWQTVLDAKPVNDGADNATNEWMPLQPTVLRILQLVLELPETSQLDDVARYTVSIFVRSSALSAGIQESILWLVTKCCPVSIWSVVWREELCSPTELACLRFLCKMNQTVGVSQALVQEIHARYTPLLLSFGTQRGDLDADEQRMVFWLITSLLLHTVISEERHTKPKPHMSLADALYLYIDFPLASMSHEGAERIRQKTDAFMYPLFARMHAAHSERNWNLHTRGQLLPVCGRQSLSKAAAEKVFTSVLHVYAHVINNVFENTSTISPEAVTDVFFSLSTLTAGNASLLKHSPTLDGTIASNVLHHVYNWYRKYCATPLSNVDSKANVLNFRMGLFPESSTNLEFTDTYSVALSANIISGLFVRGNETIANAVDVSAILEKLLCMDIVSHQAALMSVVVMSGASTRKEMNRIAPLFTQRLFRDLDMCCKGSLSTSFAILQLLRSAFSIVAAIPDDTTTMKVCEAVWNGIVVRGLGGRRAQYYAHFLLQSIVCMSTVSHTQWCVLRNLVVQSSDMSAKLQSNVSFASSLPPSASVQPTAKAKLSFAEEMREKLDRFLDQDAHVVDPNDQFMIHVRQSSIFSHAVAGGPSSSQAPSVGYTSTANAPSDQHSVVAPSDVNAPFASAEGHHFVHWTCRLLKLTTSAAVILRSKSDEEQADHNRVLVMDLLSQVEDAPSMAGHVFLYAVVILLHEVLDANDAMFVVLNRFNFAESSLILFNAEAQRAVLRAKQQDPKLATMIVIPQMTLFFETALRRLESSENCWWTLCNLVVALASLWADTESKTRPFMRLISKRLPSDDCVRIAHFAMELLAGTPGHKKDMKMFLKSAEGAAKTSRNASTVSAVAHTISAWI